jgi:Putative auto-transporter adhesin, head GIN domain
MKASKFVQNTLFFLFSVLGLISCVRELDPGPLQNDERDFAILDFDRIDMGDAFVITVEQSPVYSVHVRGDRRNLDDLAVVKIGSTLNVHYGNHREHEHTTYITIRMPVIKGANLSGASSSTISGFKGVDGMELILSGAAISQLNIELKLLTINLSGASRLTVSGKTDAITAKASGASELYAYSFSAIAADVDASGASKVNVYASQSLKAVASGAGIIYYRGEPSVNVSVSGAGLVQKD